MGVISANRNPRGAEGQGRLRRAERGACKRGALDVPRRQGHHPDLSSVACSVARWLILNLARNLLKGIR